MSPLSSVVHVSPTSTTNPFPGSSVLHFPKSCRRNSSGFGPWEARKNSASQAGLFVPLAFRESKAGIPLALNTLPNKCPSLFRAWVFCDECLAIHFK